MPRFAPFLVLALCLFGGVTRVAAQDVVIIVPADAPPSAPGVETPEVVIVGPAEVPAVDVPPQGTVAETSVAEGQPPHIVTTELELPEPRPFVPGFFSIGLSGLLGSRDDSESGLQLTWTAGLDVGFRLAPWLTLGARRVGYSQASTLLGERHAIGGSPMVELALPLWPRIVPYAQVGAGVQVRFGGEQGRSTGVAPFVGGGVRFFVADIFSIAVESALHVPVTDGYLFGHEVLPQGALVLQSGLAFAFHIQ